LCAARSGQHSEIDRFFSLRSCPAQLDVALQRRIRFAEYCGSDTLCVHLREEAGKMNLARPVNLIVFFAAIVFVGGIVVGAF
jgi:hypothetical protein